MTIIYITLHYYSVHALLIEHPESIIACDTNHCTPLHIAAMTANSVHTIDVLLYLLAYQNPSSTNANRIKEIENDEILASIVLSHSIIDSSHTYISCLTAFLIAFTSLILPNISSSSSSSSSSSKEEDQDQDQDGIENEKNKKILQNKLLLQFKQRVAESGGEKRHLPIHFAAQYQLNCEVPQLLYEVSPDTLSIQDKFGNTPLGVSLLYNTSCEIIRLLLALSSTGFI